MNRKTVVTMGGAAAAVTGLLVPSTAAAAPIALTSSIRSATLSTCLDVGTTNPAQGFLDIYGHGCDGSTTQAFTFHPLSAGPTNTFEITSQASGRCIDQYRQGIRQESCTGSVPPDYTNAEWTLQRVGTTGHRYLFVETSTLGTLLPKCVQTYPKPNGYPGPLFTLSTCDKGEPAQVYTLTGTP